MSANRLKTLPELSGHDVFQLSKKGQEEAWNEESRYITEEDFIDARLPELMKRALPDFAYYGVTRIDQNALKRLQILSGEIPESRELVQEIIGFADGEDLVLYGI